MASTDTIKLVLDQGLTALLWLVLLSGLGFFSTKAYEGIHESSRRRKRLRDLLLQLQFEVPETRARAWIYSSELFISEMDGLIDHHSAEKIPFKPFVPLIYSEEKYKVWEDLVVDLPESLMVQVKKYMDVNRLIYAILVKMQSDEFSALIAIRQKAAMRHLARMNAELVRACETLEKRLVRHARYGKQPWADPDHPTLKR